VGFAAHFLSVVLQALNFLRSLLFDNFFKLWQFDYSARESIFCDLPKMAVGK
jgi:hypothetical protein